MCMYAVCVCVFFYMVLCYVGLLLSEKGDFASYFHILQRAPHHGVQNPGEIHGKVKGVGRYFGPLGRGRGRERIGVLSCSE